MLINILTQNGELIEAKYIYMSHHVNPNEQYVESTFRVNGKVIGWYKNMKQAENIRGEIEMAFASNKLIYAMPGLEENKKC